MKHDPHFIVFDGLDGAGKSTGIAAVAEHLKKLGHEVVLTREPGGTTLGEQLREILLSVNTIVNPRTEAMLMFANRCHHVETVIRPALARGAFVLCDRFSDSTFAYQGAKGVEKEILESLEAMSNSDLKPGITILYDLPVSVSRERLGKTGKTPDRFESMSDIYFQKVREIYLERAKADTEHYRVVDATLTPEQVAEACVEACLSKPKKPRP